VKLSIINPGGLDNFGERAILVGTIYDLKDKYPSSQIAIYGYETVAELDPPMYQMMQDNGVKLYPRLVSGAGMLGKAWHVASFIISAKRVMGSAAFEHLAHSEVIYAKGQESLTSSYGHVHFIDSVLEPLMAQHVNKKVVLYGHSVGPVSSWLDRQVARYTLKRLHHVYARDKLSQKTLEDLGYPADSITVIKDLAYTAIQRIPELQGKAKPQHYLVIPNAAILKDARDRERYLRTLRTLMDELKKRNEQVIIASSVTATGWNNDYDICQELASQYPEATLKRYTTLNELLLDIKSAKRVISSRLHPIIMATGMAVPILALSQAPKVAGVLSDFMGPGYELHHPFESTEGDLLSAL
jgi:polysaccharide pyruvyl transferase WcaK-like protein